MKTYVITLSKHFLKGHPKAGEPTYFGAKLYVGLGRVREIDEKFGMKAEIEGRFIPKIHTIRGNYDLWANRIKDVQEGKAVLSIRQWAGKPYNSPQTPLATLTAADGVGVQEIRFAPSHHYDDRRDLNPLGTWCSGHKYTSDFGLLAANDGLSEQDFRDWFKGYDLSQTMAIIHFTGFRY